MWLLMNKPKPNTLSATIQWWSKWLESRGGKLDLFGKLDPYLSYPPWANLRGVWGCLCASHLTPQWHQVTCFGCAVWNQTVRARALCFVCHNNQVAVETCKVGHATPYNLWWSAGGWLLKSTVHRALRMLPVSLSTILRSAAGVSAEEDILSGCPQTVKFPPQRCT